MPKNKSQNLFPLVQAPEVNLRVAQNQFAAFKVTTAFHTPEEIQGIVSEISRRLRWAKKDIVALDPDRKSTKAVKKDLRTAIQRAHLQSVRYCLHSLQTNPSGSAKWKEKLAERVDLHLSAVEEHLGRNSPNVSVVVGEMRQSLRRVRGGKVVNPAVQNVVVVLPFARRAALQTDQP